MNVGGLLRLASLLGVGAAALILIRLSARSRRVLERRCAELEAELVKAKTERQAERTGRIRVQQELRSFLIRSPAAPGTGASSSSSSSSGSGVPSKAAGGGCHTRGDGGGDGHGERPCEGTGIANGSGGGGGVDSAMVAYPMTPIGVIRSCFMTRNGTPRQPGLVAAAKARVELSRGGVSAAALEGLQEYSHCWVLFVFHANTDLPRLWRDKPHADFRAKVRVPRLEGGKKGALATRSPHHPLPIGLSVAKVEGVEGRTVLLSGVDIVDGTPVLDVKPYLPYCDAVPAATAPPWAQADDGPLSMRDGVEFATGVEVKLKACWEAASAMARGAACKWIEDTDVAAAAASAAAAHTSVSAGPEDKIHAASISMNGSQAGWGGHISLPLCSSWQELRELVRQVLQRDIRSAAQRRNPRAAPGHRPKPSQTCEGFKRGQSVPGTRGSAGEGESDAGRSNRSSSSGRGCDGVGHRAPQGSATSFPLVCASRSSPSMPCGVEEEVRGVPGGSSQEVGDGEPVVVEDAGGRCRQVGNDAGQGHGCVREGCAMNGTWSAGVSPPSQDSLGPRGGRDEAITANRESENRAMGSMWNGGCVQLGSEDFSLGTSRGRQKEQGISVEETSCMPGGVQSEPDIRNGVVYHLLLDGVDVSYRVLDGKVLVIDACAGRV